MGFGDKLEIQDGNDVGNGVGTGDWSGFGPLARGLKSAAGLLWT